MATFEHIAIYYEHPEWFRPLFAELDRRGLPYEALRADQLILDPVAGLPAAAVTAPVTLPRGRDSSLRSWGPPRSLQQYSKPLSAREPIPLHSWGAQRTAKEQSCPEPRR